jgi:hypothetical protein
MLFNKMDLSRARDTDSGARVTSSLSLARGPDGEVVRPPMSGERSWVDGRIEWALDQGVIFQMDHFFLPGAYFHVGCIH